MSGALREIRRYLLRSRQMLQLTAVVLIAAAAAIMLPFFEGEPDGAKIETIGSDEPEAVAMQQVGADQVQVPGLLRVEGGDPGTGASGSDAVDPAGGSPTTTSSLDSASAPEATSTTATAGQPLEAPVDTSVVAGGQADSSTTSSRNTTTTRSSGGSGEPLTTLRTTTSQRRATPSSQRSTSTSTGVRPDPTVSQPTTSRPATSRPVTSRPTTSRPATSPSTTSGPTTSSSRPATSTPTTERTAPVAPAQIPFVNNGVGDGARGGQSPYSPPQASLGFTNIADKNVTTVEASCGSASVDCGAQIKNILRTNNTRPLKITFGDASRRGATVTFRTPIQLQSDVYLEGINQPKVVVTASTILFNVSGTKNVSIRNFDLDLQRCSIGSSPVVAATNPVENLYVSGIKVLNAQKSATEPCSADFVRLSANGTGKNIHIYDNDVSWVRRFIRIMNNTENVRIYNNTIREIGKEGYVQTAGVSRNVYIEGNIFSRHSPNAQGGHMIGFPISTADSAQTYAYNVIVRNNLVEGRPNIAHLRDGTQAAPNGAAGDLIALRGIDGFLLEGNMVRHSGEVGITATAGLKNGVIRYNQISYTDTTGIVLGNVARNGNERVRNVDVYRNELFQNSLDRSGEFRNKNQQHPAFSLWNTSDSCMVNNYIHHNANNGFWVYDGMNPGWPGSEVWDVYIADNAYNNNRNDFVAKRSHAPPFTAASPYGGERWTTTFDRAIDNDGDGLPGLCATERNDNDPCSPDVYAEACRR